MKLPAKRWIAIDEKTGEALDQTLRQTREDAIAAANSLAAGDWNLRFHAQEILIFAIHHDTEKKLLSQEL